MSEIATTSADIVSSGASRIAPDVVDDVAPPKRGRGRPPKTPRTETPGADHNGPLVGVAAVRKRGRPPTVAKAEKSTDAARTEPSRPRGRPLSVKDARFVGLTALSPEQWGFIRGYIDCHPNAPLENIAFRFSVTVAALQETLSRPLV